MLVLNNDTYTCDSGSFLYVADFVDSKCPVV